MNRRFIAMAPALAGRQPENYVLGGGGLDLEDAAAVRPPLEPSNGWGGVDELAGPLQPAWGWENKNAPRPGVDPETALRDLRMNPAEHTFNMQQDARQGIALRAYGRIDATAIDAASPTRGSYVDLMPQTYVGEMPITDGDWPETSK